MNYGKSADKLLRWWPQEISLPGLLSVLSWDIAYHDHQEVDLITLVTKNSLPPPKKHTNSKNIY